MGRMSDQNAYECSQQQLAMMSDPSCRRETRMGVDVRSFCGRISRKIYVSGLSRPRQMATRENFHQHVRNCSLTTQKGPSRRKRSDPFCVRRRPKNAHPDHNAHDMCGKPDVRKGPKSRDLDRTYNRISRSPVPAHRKALTGLLLGDHLLSVEQLRYPARYQDAVPHDHILCRLCRGAVEDEVHALFDCIVELRARFLDKLSGCDPALHESYTQLATYGFLLRLIPSRIFAMFVFDVLELFQEFPRFFPVSPIILPRLPSAFVRCLGAHLCLFGAYSSSATGL
ncbi:hypothetical protein B0H13DRAFT_310682 [Mycena leptocephala]|nr:hypothetical protein B0H13DRAFT_310682 [Mycena leptocephala]